MNSDVWILGDNRIGGLNQAIALAEEIGQSYEIKNIKYNIFGNLPNFILSIKPIHIKASTLQQLDVQIPPKIIISAGRRTAILALYLKKKFNNTIKIIQIMRPCSSLNNFDFVILPQHDKISQTAHNVIRIIGALNNIKAKSNIGQATLVQYYPEVKNFIAVIIGGATKNYQFTASAATKFAHILSNITNNHSIPLFISFSRRTPEIVQKIIRSKFSLPHIIYDPTENRPNPYFGMLADAEYIITTGDSISICSEAASTGKPFYIFCPEEFKLKKHRFFIQQLIDLKTAKILDDSTIFLEKYSYNPLCEVKKVVEIIKQRNLP